jgi:hypothetical protein
MPFSVGQTGLLRTEQLTMESQDSLFADCYCAKASLWVVSVDELAALSRSCLSSVIHEGSTRGRFPAQHDPPPEVVLRRTTATLRRMSAGKNALSEGPLQRESEISKWGRLAKYMRTGDWRAGANTHRNGHNRRGIVGGGPPCATWRRSYGRASPPDHGRAIHNAARPSWVLACGAGGDRGARS